MLTLALLRNDKGWSYCSCYLDDLKLLVYPDGFFCFMYEVVIPNWKLWFPGASNKLGEWVTEWVHDFSLLASSAMEAVKETKLGTKVA